MIKAQNFKSVVSHPSLLNEIGDLNGKGWAIAFLVAFWLFLTGIRIVEIFWNQSYEVRRLAADDNAFLRWTGFRKDLFLVLSGLLVCVSGVLIGPAVVYGLEWCLNWLLSY